MSIKLYSTKYTVSATRVMVCSPRMLKHHLVWARTSAVAGAKRIQTTVTGSQGFWKDPKDAGYVFFGSKGAVWDACILGAAFAENAP